MLPPICAVSPVWSSASSSFQSRQSRQVDPHPLGRLPTRFVCRPLLCPAPLAQREAEQSSRRRPYLVGPAQGGCGLALRRAQAGIPRIDREVRQEEQPPLERLKCRVVTLDDGQEFVEVVGLRNPDPEFLEQRLEVFLRTLLAVKANQVMDGRFVSGEASGAAEVGLGLPYPRARRRFHIRPRPSR